MTLTIELTPELERRFQEEAARRGQPEEYVLALVRAQLHPEPSQREKNEAAIRLLQAWAREDAENPDPDPVPEIPPLSLREVSVD